MTPSQSPTRGRAGRRRKPKSALRYADEVVIPCAPSPVEINRTTAVREGIAEVEAARDKPARSTVLLNRCIARAHSTADAREALQGLGYDVLATAVPRLENASDCW